MAIVTVELRHLLQMNFKLFDFTYQCSDPVWKDELEQAIKDYYFFEEIGQETPERFKHVFKETMIAIMPYYDQLHELSKIPLDTSDLTTHGYTETLTKTNEKAVINSGSDISTSDVTSDNKNTEYPQHSNIVDDIPSGRSVSTSGSNNSITFGGKQDETLSEDYTKVVEGYDKNKIELKRNLIQEYKKSLMRINGMIIRDLKHCFILIY